jgi:hypothetical protein
MQNDRFRVPVEAAYTSAIGLAVYAFARLEWDAVWCCERISPNSINKLADRTAGGVANKLIELAGTLAASPQRIKLVQASAEFKELVETRNKLVHAKPGTDSDGGQRLFRDGQPWTVEMIDVAADAFTACSGRLNALLHGFLAASPASASDDDG